MFNNAITINFSKCQTKTNKQIIVKKNEIFIFNTFKKIIIYFV